MTIWDHLSSNENRDVASEEILNVLREHDGLVLGTADIAGKIGMSVPGTQSRLEELEADGRVTSQYVGGNLVWGLHPDERQEPIEPEIDRLVRGFDEIRDTFKVTRFLGGAIVLAGFAFMFLGLTAGVMSTSLPVVTPSKLIAYGYAVAAAGGAAWGFGGAITYGTSIAEKFATWRVRKAKSAESEDESTATETARGQVDTPYLFIAGFVVVLIAGPLLELLVELQAGFAELPGISPFMALGLAALIVAAVVAAIFEDGD